MKPFLFLLILTACGADPTAPQLEVSGLRPVPGQLQPINNCWPDSTTAPLAGFPWCGRQN